MDNLNSEEFKDMNLDDLELVDCHYIHDTYGIDFICEDGHVTKVIMGNN